MCFFLTSTFIEPLPDYGRFARDTSRASADIWSAPSLLFIRAKRYFNVTVAVAEWVNAPETPVKVMV
jgi:hypothetical protein